MSSRFTIQVVFSFVLFGATALGNTLCAGDKMELGWDPGCMTQVSSGLSWNRECVDLEGDERQDCLAEVCQRKFGEHKKNDLFEAACKAIRPCETKDGEEGKCYAIYMTSDEYCGGNCKEIESETVTCHHVERVIDGKKYDGIWGAYSRVCRKPCGVLTSTEAPGTGPSHDTAL